ncbi:hypothetical protein TVAG_116980 [Trichomonas vaginalis G3]|uniref:Uncharacterized protein n=1 Tax=Trichomonas vaginalis (strain ATCC PRA-98 / G3) TaxID=412133 RepID=A2E3N8_TRIV3|nr:hypothetical protein TVAGG3_0507860 [Trichomonas vaginalis G3]EAY12676.1 hypothetical protein TVAG_116980 [Trichomonas vaginalis G3]KAI5517562.1 hypothetical protein TVAGG3_0507860 [Trichomonas vaginalis G3]|eukprot:XP_001324899.1 hypothetical protein [Trichomonas vaginalis G3]
MDQFQEIADNFKKLQILDQKLNELKSRAEAPAEKPVQVKEENVELQLLLEELEQQQKISVQLSEYNTKLQKRLQKKKSTLIKVQDEFDVFKKSQNDFIQKRKKVFQEQQDIEEQNALKEEKRLKSSLQLLLDRNRNLKDEKQLIENKLAVMKNNSAKNKKKN